MKRITDDRRFRIPPVLEPLERRALLNAVPVGAEFNLNPPQTGRQEWPQVAHDAAGNFVAVWTSATDRQLLGAFARRFDASGNPLGDEFRVGAQSYGAPAIAMDPAGDFVVAWGDAFATTGRVHLRRYSAAGVPQGQEILLPQETGEPSLAMASDGDFVLVYGITDSRRPQYQVYSADGTPRGPAADVNEGPPPPIGIYGPASVASDAAGNFVVGFARDFAYFRRFDPNGQPLGPSAPVMPADSLARPTGEVMGNVAMNGAGDFVVSVYGLPGLSVRAFGPTGAPRSARVLLAEGLADVDRMDVDVAADGGFVATWVEQFPTGIRARAYDAAGVALGDAFTATANGALPTVTLGAGGDMLFTWLKGVGVDMNGADADAYARRYARVEKPAAIDRVFVKGTDWTGQFNNYLGEHGFGTPAYGYAAGGTPDPQALPWTNLDEITIRFTRDVGVERNDLTVRGITRPTYDFEDFDYDPATHAATWTLDRPIGADRLTLTLNSAVVLPGDVDATDWAFPLNVLPGDAYRDEAVNAVDLGRARLRQLTSTGNYYTSQPGITYKVFFDLNGDGRVNAIDMGLARSKQLTFLPPTPEQPPLRGASPVRRDLFGTNPVLG